MINAAGAQGVLTASMAQATPYAIIGASSAKVAASIANAFVSWGVQKPSNLTLVGVATGTAGAGTITAITSKILAPSAVPAAQAAAAAYLRGPTGSSMASAIALWISTLLGTQGQYQGVSTSVAVGSDASKFGLINLPVLEGLLASQLGGPSAQLVGKGIAAAVQAALLVATGTASVTGVGGGSPSSGATLSVLI